jgi:uncharacterized protein (TIGR02646 family)
MRNITKKPEPTSLRQHRLTPHSDFDNYQEKDALRRALVEEQRGLCCYCLQPIQPDGARMKIEHWHSQERYKKDPDERLLYWNLLGVCKGNEGQPEADQHCDTFKGERDLSRNPAIPLHNVEALIHYLPNGRIASSNAQFDAELNGVLNLNVPYLVNSRLGELRAFQKTLIKRPVLLNESRANRRKVRQSWGSLLSEWEGNSNFGDLKPFCGVIVYWIKKKLARVPA